MSVKEEKKKSIVYNTKCKASPELLRNYQSIIGSLLYLMIGTCPLR
jgi:hypothetical protein